MIPLSAGIIAVSVAVSGAAGFYAGHRWATGTCDAEKVAQARDEAVARIAGAAAAASAAEAISRIEVRNVTIRQPLETIVRTEQVFRDCRSGPDAVRLLNSTPGIDASAAVAAGASGVRAASGANR